MDVGSLKLDSPFTPIRQQWESLKTMFPKTEMHDSGPSDLEGQIREAQAQLAQLKKQRELIDIQQKVAEETRDLELARSRLSAITSAASPPPAASKEDPRANAWDRGSQGQGPQKKQCIAREPPTGPANIHPSRRIPEPSTPRPQAKPAQPKPPQKTPQLKQAAKNPPAKVPAKPQAKQAPKQPKVALPHAPKQTPPQGPKAAPPQAPQPTPPQAPKETHSQPPQPAPQPSPQGSKPNTSSLSLQELRALAAATLRGKGPNSQPSPTPTPVKAPNPPTQPASASKPINQPPVPNVAVYHGRALGEFKNYTLGLERHFGKYPDWYRNEENKVTRALKHVSLPLEHEWKQYIRTESANKNTYLDFCTFMISQLQKGIRPETAKVRYYESYQRTAQSVTDFSNWMMQWPTHFPNRDSERDRMRHLFEHTMRRVQNESEKTHLDFDHYHEFVQYLQSVEDSIESRQESLGRGRDNNPRKRSRD